MDFRNLCQNIDVDSIRAKLPSLPDISAAMPQIKLPKSFPKLRSRRIFRSSREDVSRSSSKKQPPAQPPIQPADFINHSPRRISTIASLMNENGTPQQGTYRSARSIEDDYPTPRQFHSQTSRPISPVRIPSGVAEAHASGEAVAKMSLTERLQKSYKDISEFRLKHIFAKQTVVRKDNIEVDHYVEHYNEDRIREQQEQEKRDRQIAENYRFNFKISRQNTGHTNSLSSNDSPVHDPKDKTAKTVSAQSGDESGMEITPPKRKPGIASTRFSKVRNPPLQQTMSVESNEPNNEQTDDERATTNNHSPPESKSTAESAGKGIKALSKLRNFGKRNEDTPEASAEKRHKAPLTPQQSEEQDTAPATSDNALNTIKQNFKRFQKSIKRQPTSVDESEDEATPQDAKHVSKTEKLAARLRKLKSRESSVDNLNDNDAKTSPKKEEEHKSPIRAAITNKLQTWKKSFKRRPNEAEATNTGDETSPEKEKRSDNNLIKKLKYIRSRKHANSTDDLDADDDEDASPTTSKPKDSKDVRKSSNFEERFEQARQRTMKKVNEKMQQMKFFHKSQEHIDKENPKNTKNGNKSEDDDDHENNTSKIPPTIARRSVADDSPTNSEPEDIEEINNTRQEYALQKTRTIWTTKNLLSDSLDSETDSELPRVLIHQDNSDVFESTLIIAVTRPASQSPTPKITEITPENRARSSRSRSPEWIPNTEIISSFLEITPPSKRRLSSDGILPIAPIRGHARKLSMDSNSDSDSWMPENIRNSKQTQSKADSPLTALNSIDENEEPWKVHTMYREEKLYKTKSIDIFEKNVEQGGASGAFEDFDDALKDEPIVKIIQRNVDCFEKDSSEELDAADDDNSSRVTKILVTAIKEECEEEIKALEDTKLVPAVPARQLGNSCESLITNVDGHEQNYVDFDEEDDDRPPSTPPSPPPSTSPPPPPLPRRKPSIRMPKPIMETPPLPTSKPPPPPPIKPAAPPPRIPERTPSMTRIAKPLVKTSSLRLAYNEQVKPSDVGKVNKLISRFEQPAPTMQRPRIIARRTIHDDNSEEEYSDDEEGDDIEDDDTDQDAEMLPTNTNAKFERDTTPTPTNTPRMSSVDSNESFHAINVITTNKTHTKHIVTTETTKAFPTQKDKENNVTTALQEHTKTAMDIPKISLNVDNNSNASFSRASSEYGSPLSSLIGSTETTPVADRRKQDLRSAERSRRSMTRDDDRFLSFDSDEENSYYSISSSGSSRYVVEI